MAASEPMFLDNVIGVGSSGCDPSPLTQLMVPMSFGANLY